MYNTGSNGCFRGTQNIIYRKIKHLDSNFRNVNNLIGDLRHSASNVDFNGWLNCDGRSLLISDYSQLFAVIGTSFGQEDDLHFNIPNSAGRVIGSIGTTGNEGDSSHVLGDSVGAENITLSVNQIPQHNHNGTTDQNGLHDHSINDPTHNHGYLNQAHIATPAVSLTTENVASTDSVSQTTSSSTTGITINTNGNHTHTYTTNNTGGGASHYNVQPTLFVGNLFIYATYVPYI